MKDPEIRDLQIATARAYAIAERLAHELEGTVDELTQYVATRPIAPPAETDVSPSKRRRSK